MTAGAGAADALRVTEGERQALAGGVLLDGHDARNAAALLVLAADQVARALRGDHADVDATHGLMKSKRMFRPWPKNSASPSLRLSLMDSS